MRVFQAFRRLKFNMVGTFRKNRTDPSLTLKKCKKNVGVIKWCVSTEKPPVHVWGMVDRGALIIGSTMHRSDAYTEIKRRSGANVETLKAPSALKDYNEHMGGCDLSDQLRASYRVQRVRQMRWYMCLFYWALDVMIINSYIIYSSVAGAPPLDHKNFRLQLAMYLIRGADVVTAPPKTPKRIRVEESLPAFRLAKGNHFPAKLGTRGNCVMCYRRGDAKLEKRTSTQCTTCGKPLCISCWEEWHTR